MYNDLWISNKVLDWKACESSSSSDLNMGERAYGILDHALTILNNHSSPLYMVDVVTTLKRAVNHRLKTLNKIYEFDTIPINSKPIGLLRQLEFFGIIKPLMLQELLKIRNDVEHNDRTPPKKIYCQKLYEFVWYFLRSTDVIASKKVESMSLLPSGKLAEDCIYWIAVTMNAKSIWKINMSGWFHANLLFAVDKNNTFRLNVNKAETKNDFLKRIKSLSKNSRFFKEMVSDISSAYPPDPSFLYLDGQMMIDEKAMTKIFKKYFSLL